MRENTYTKSYTKMNNTCYVSITGILRQSERKFLGLEWLPMNKFNLSTGSLSHSKLSTNKYP